MSESFVSTSGVSLRYATAIFALAKEEGRLNDLEKDIIKLGEAIKVSQDIKDFIGSPVFSRIEQERVVEKVADKLKLHKYTKNLLKLMAKKRRLTIIPDVINNTHSLLEESRSEMRVEVRSAISLTKAQQSKLESTLHSLVGKKIKLGLVNDKSLIGGLIIKLGSKMIDTTTKSKLLKLQNIMKEVN